MSTLGYSGTAGYGTFSQISTTTEVAVQATTPVGGIYVTQVAAHFKLYSGGPATCWLCVWNSSGTLLISEPVGVGSNQMWQYHSVNNYFIAGGQTIYIGFAVPSANGFTTGYDNTGTSYWGVQSSPPGNTAFAASGFGDIGAYLTYVTGLSATPNDLQVFDGTNLRTLSLFAFDGTHLRASTLHIYDGSILRQIQ